MHYRDNQEPLFSKAHLSDALRAQTDSVADRVQSISESVLRAADDAELTDQLAEDLRIVPLRLDQQNQTMRREETPVDVTGDPRRFGFPDGRRLIVPGLRVTVSIPYVGDEQLWGFQPSTYRLSGPRGIVRAQRGRDRGVLDLVIEQPSDEPLEKVKSELQSRIEDISFFIDSQSRDLAGIDNTLRQHIGSALTQRRSRLKKHDGLADLLGIPEVAPTAATATSRQLPRSTPQRASPSAQALDAWDVFVSHASEDKDSFVRPLVAALTKAGLKVWFDEQELRVGDSLRRSIDRGLARSRFGIVVISPSFLAKHWPQKELDGLVAREEDGSKVILPVWHEITAPEVRQSSPTLADRLAVSSARGAEEVARELLRVIKPA